MIPEAINGFLNSSRKISLTNSKINKDPYSFIFDSILFCKRHLKEQEDLTDFDLKGGF